MDARCRIELFGWLRVHQDGRVITRFQTHQTAAALAYMAFYSHRSHSRDLLMSVAWPGDGDSADRHKLRIALSSLRRQIEPPGVPPGAVVIADRHTVQLSPALVTTDVREFEAALELAARARNSDEREQRLSQAAALYRGELLPGYFEEWVVPERQRLAEAHFRALEGLVQCRERRGDLTAAIEVARRAVNEDPLREEWHRELIRLLIANDETDAAQRQFETLERLLQEQFGSRPTLATCELVSLAGSPGAPTRPHHPTRLRGPTSAPAPDYSERTATHFAVTRPEAVTRRAGDGACPGLAWAEPHGCSDRTRHPSTHSAGAPGYPNGAGDEAEGQWEPVGTERLPAMRSGAAVTGSRLPLRLNRFFDREVELAQLMRLLFEEKRRLVTLTGPGGCGKTRLALELADRFHRDAAAAVWFVPLVDLSDPRLILGKIEDGLGLPRDPGVEPLERVVAFLRPHASLLLLDNYEQLTPDGVPLLAMLLQRVESVTLLVTSRHRLGLEGEREFPVGVLAVPGVQAFGRSGVQDRQKQPDLGTAGPERLNAERLNALAQCPSVALFVDRAQAVRPDFQVTARNATAVAELCARLEGLPLAIELAAARSQVLTPAQMLAQLDSTRPLRGHPSPGGTRFELLTSRRRGAEARHESFWAALEWSYRLLSPPLQRFFARLSVFRGGWTAEAAEVIGEEPAALDYLTQLRGYSLVLLEEGETELRYRMLETLREFGADQLALEEREALAQRHAEFYTEFAEQADLKLTGREQMVWAIRLDAEHPNLRAALAWSLEADVAIGLALRLCVALQPFWHLRQRDREGLGWIEGALELSRMGGAAMLAALRAKASAHAGELASTVGGLDSSASTRERARTHFEAGLAAARERGDRAVEGRCLIGLAGAAGEWRGQLDYQVNRERCEAALAIFRELGDGPGIARAHGQLAYMASREEDAERARDYAEAAVQAARELEDRRALLMPLHVLGMLAHRQGDLARARRHHEQRLLLIEELGFQYLLPQVLAHLGQIAFDQGDDASARSFYERAVEVSRQADRFRFDLALALCGLGDIARRRGEYAAAREFHAECWPIFRELGYLLGALHSLNALGAVARLAGDHCSAWASLEKSLTLLREWTDEAKSAECLEELAQLLDAEGRQEPAARFLAAAEALREAAGDDWRPTPGHPRYPRTPPVALARRLREGFPAAWAAGCEMGALAAIAEARAALGETDFEAAQADGRATALRPAIIDAPGRTSLA